MPALKKHFNTLSSMASTAFKVQSLCGCSSGSTCAFEEWCIKFSYYENVSRFARGTFSVTYKIWLIVSKDL